MVRADLRDSDSFFENEMESDVEQTLISADVDPDRANLPVADFLNGSDDVSDWPRR
jgi:hypothetical protein